MEENEKSVKGGFYAVIITQFICVAVLIFGVLAIKYLSVANFKKISKFYGDTLCEKTSVSDIKKYFGDEI